MTLYMLNLCDLISTLVGFRVGLEEINPIINALIRIHPALFPLVKIVVAFPLCLRIARAAKQSWLDWLVYAALVVVQAAVVGSNLKNILTFWRCCH